MVDDEWENRKTKQYVFLQGYLWKPIAKNSFSQFNYVEVEVGGAR